MPSSLLTLAVKRTAWNRCTQGARSERTLFVCHEAAKEVQPKSVVHTYHFSRCDLSSKMVSRVLLSRKQFGAKAGKFSANRMQLLTNVTCWQELPHCQVSNHTQDQVSSDLLIVATKTACFQNYDTQLQMKISWEK